MDNQSGQLPQPPNDLLQAVFGFAAQMATQISDDDRMNLQELPPEQIFSELGTKLFSTLNQSPQIQELKESLPPGPPSKVNTSSKRPVEKQHQQQPPKSRPPTTTAVVDHDQDQEESDELVVPKSDNIEFTLEVTLEEMYKGKKKHLKLRRKQYREVKDPKTKKKKYEFYEEEKRLLVPIAPGVASGQTMCYKGESHRIPNHEPGDVIITIEQIEHEYFDRDDNNLFLMLNISLGEIYKLNQRWHHLDGRVIEFTNDPKDPLIQNLFVHHRNIRKITGEGMPYYNDSENRYGDLFVRFNVIFPDILETEQITKLLEIAPSVHQIDIKENEEVIVKQLERISDEDIETFEYEDDDTSGEDSSDFNDDDDSDEDDSNENDSKESGEDSNESDQETREEEPETKSKPEPKAKDKPKPEPAAAEEKPEVKTKPTK
jgi:hypothetical protein